MAQLLATVGGPYLWEREAWPDRLTWNAQRVGRALGAAREAHGRMQGQAALVGFGDRHDLEVGAYADEALHSAGIEGERLDRASVRSSVARQLGLARGGLPRSPRHVDGLVEVLLDATRNAAEPVTEARLFGWQAALFPSGFSGTHRIAVGAFRTGAEPMRVVSGVWGAPTVHFEAPPSTSVPAEVAAFLRWLAQDAAADELAGDPFVRAGLAHLRFVTIHPFDDGNGRVTRALTDLVLARGEPSGQARLWSLSPQIERDREGYYEALQRTQRGDGDLTEWLVWFLGCTARALGHAVTSMDRVFTRVRFWAEHPRDACNPRQVKIVERMLEAAPDPFEGGMTTRKAAALTRASRATAQRDLADLVASGILRPLASGGRSTAYMLALDRTEPLR